MNQHLQTILNFIQRAEHLSDEEKAALLKDAKAADKELEITAFKLERTEKVKHTTAILLEETIEELEQKRKAVEAQNKELEIEAALEKVRSRSLAIHKSDELKEVVTVLFEKLKGLQIPVTSAGITIFPEGSKDMNIYVCGQNDDGLVISNYQLPYFNHPICNDFHTAREKHLDFFVGNYSKDEKNSFYEYVLEFSSLRDLPNDIKEMIFKSPKYSISMAAVNNSMIAINDFEGKLLSENETDIIKRFARVFEQAYTRFLDLQKAEAQARESKIQLALERARTQTMIMQHSKELDDTLRVFHELVLQLGIKSAFSFLWLPDEEKDRHIFWAAWAENESTIFKSKAINYPLDRNEPATAQCLIDWKSNEPVVAYHVPPASVNDYFSAWSELIAGVEELEPENFSDGLYYVEAFMKYGCFGVIVKNTLPEDEKKILSRFAVEFERAYRRFLDLQKAEAQAREAQIQLALERVRARTMAMQKSDELNELIKILFSELRHLEISLDRCLIMTYDPQTLDSTWWMASRDDISYKTGLLVPYHTNSPQLAYIKGWQERKEKWTYLLEGDEKKEWDEFLFGYTALEKLPDEVIAGMRNLEKNFSSASFKSFGCLTTGSFEPLSDDAFDILIRFTQVFDQAYTRFLDLQTAEAQAREAQIEIALEKVRSRSLAMHASDELREVVAVVFEKLQELDFTMNDGAAIIITFIKDSKDHIQWIADTIQAFAASFKVPYSEHSLSADIFNAKESGVDFFSKLYSFEEKNMYFKYLFENADDYKVLPDEVKALLLQSKDYGISIAFEKNSAIFIPTNTGKLISENEKEILKRFAKVFEQSYIRFLDLQKAEAQALEAIKRASVDRVRAEIASMRTTNDLERITPLIWNELTTLGVPFIRCGVFIMDEETERVQSFLSTPDGKAIAGFRLPYFATEQSTNIVKHWQQKKIFRDHMDEIAFAEYAKNLMARGAITSGEKYLTENRPTDLYLHFLPFLQGMLYVGNTEPLSDDALQLAQNLADAFSTAYARYEDFNKLESAKEQIEKTLVDLKQTQAQLVQSEKMASLGELTAGIAHEIQNPLNFVNNFSEVNKELLTELNEEIEKGNYEEVKIIAKDVIDNEEKISHHGKRADAIVKGMLQHSRSSSATKEATNINALADEYLRLAYHGLRAKDKSFNATLKTDYDETIGNINIIPQDIGRVILNLIMNAFYTVSEKKKQTHDHYEPTVSVITKKINNKIEINICDNGNGIPGKVIDKIFQPFFTTKPTGQGTGLGLSLAYDIIKTHNGELKVETKEGEGSEFIIQLPV